MPTYSALQSLAQLGVALNLGFGALTTFGGNGLSLENDRINAIENSIQSNNKFLDTLGHTEKQRLAVLLIEFDKIKTELQTHKLNGMLYFRRVLTPALYFFSLVSFFILIKSSLSDIEQASLAISYLSIFMSVPAFIVAGFYLFYFSYMRQRISSNISGFSGKINKLLMYHGTSAE